MKNIPTLIKNNGWLYASLPLNIARRTMQVALLSVFVAGTGTASASTINAVGTDTTTGAGTATPVNPPAGWGTSTTSGTKADFRSTDTDPKAYVLPGNQNVYGQDGYSFYSVGVVGSNAPITTGADVLSPGVLQLKPTYVSAITLLTPAMGNGSFNSGPGFGYMDDPRAAAASYSASNTVSYGDIRTFVNGGSSDDVSFDVLSFTLSSAQSFRVGIMSGAPYDPQNLTLTSSLGGTPGIQAGSGVGYYLQPDWYFFDVTGGVAGETFTLNLEQYGTQGAVDFAGIVFDSIPPVVAPEPATWALLGISLSMLFVLARRKSLSTVS